MARVFMRNGSVSVSDKIVAKIKHLVVKLERGYFPTRGSTTEVMAELKTMAFSMPKEFTKGSLDVLGVIQDDRGGGICGA